MTTSTLTTTKFCKLLSQNLALIRSVLLFLLPSAFPTGPPTHWCVQHIEVNKLIRARPLDNIEFMQWLKSYFDSHSNGQNLNYDAAARRAASKTGGVKGASGKARVPLSSTTTVANVNRAAPVRSASISKKDPGTRQFGQAVAVPASAASSGSQDSGMAAQVQEAAEQACLGCHCMFAALHCYIASHCCVPCHLVMHISAAHGLTFVSTLSFNASYHCCKAL